MGAGLTGATIARILRDSGKSVLVIDRRAHTGGNVHDYVHESGTRVHTYGPHYFRTNSERIWQFVNRFDTFDRYEAVVKSLVDGRYHGWPLTEGQIVAIAGPEWKPAFNGQPANFEEMCLSKMPSSVYETFIKEYTEKQWGVEAKSLSAELAARIPVREDNDPRFNTSTHQGIPSHGYAHFTSKILDGIATRLNFDYLRHKGTVSAAQTVVFTGPIDEYFGFDLGRLKYRGQQREHTYLGDTQFKLPCGQVNNPRTDGGQHIRTLEWKHMLPSRFKDALSGTVLTTETPFTPTDPEQYEYPFPDEANAALYVRYKARAEQMPGLVICGRLGEYRYYDMDQCIAKAFIIAERLLAGSRQSSKHCCL